MKRLAQVVGYCASCRWFVRHAEERPVDNVRDRFGRCRRRVKLLVPSVAACDRYEPMRAPGGR